MLQSTIHKYALPFVLLALHATGCFAATPALPPMQQAKVEKYKILLAYWARQPEVIDAAKAANKKPLQISNASWDRLAENDPFVLKIGSSKISRQLEKWEADQHIIKLNLRDLHGNLVAYSAASGKPLIYNIKTREPFINGLNGVWSATEIKPDPSTQQNSVQISAPVKDDAKVIGVLHSAVLIE